MGRDIHSTVHQTKMLGIWIGDTDCERAPEILGETKKLILEGSPQWSIQR